MTRPAMVLLAVIGLTVPSACTDRPDPVTAETGSVIRTDSAGVEIVELAPGALDDLPEWRLSAEPVLRIGQVDGEEPYVLGRVLDAARFPDGSIAIADGFGPTVRLYGPDGTYVRDLARGGEGPGELLQLRFIDALADGTLGMWDFRAQRATRVTLTGEVDSEWATTECPWGMGIERPGPVACIAALVLGFVGDGSLLVTDDVQSRTWPGSWNVLNVGGTVRHGRLRESGFAFSDSLQQGDNYLSGDGGGYAFRRAYGAVPVWAVGRSGTVYGHTASGQIAHRAPDGSLARLVRLGLTPAPVTPEALQRFEDHAWGEMQEYYENWWANVEPAEVIPLFSELLLDDAGRIWLGDFDPRYIDPPDEPSLWWVLAADGTPAATITTPPTGAMTIHQIWEDGVLGTVTDEFDVSYVVVHRIERGLP